MVALPHIEELAERRIAVPRETVLRWMNQARILTCAMEERSVAARFRLPRRFSTGRVTFAQSLA